jgi:hypothetical protein
MGLVAIEEQMGKKTLTPKTEDLVQVSYSVDTGEGAHDQLPWGEFALMNYNMKIEIKGK